MQPTGGRQCVEILIAAQFEKIAIGVKQRVLPVNQHAERNALKQDGFERGRRRFVGRRSFGSSRDDRGRVIFGRAGLAAALQPRRQFLGQFAKRVALYRAQARRLRLGHGSAEWHDIRGRRGAGWFGFVAARRRFRDRFDDRRRSYLGWRLSRLLRWRHKSDRTGLSCPRQLIDTHDVAADAETAIAAKIPVAIEHRQPGQFDRQPFAALIHRPRHRDAAPGFARGDGTRDLVLRIDFQRGRDLTPQSAERRHGSRSHEFDELVRADHEAAVGIHLPNETQRVPAFGR